MRISQLFCFQLQIGDSQSRKQIPGLSLGIITSKISGNFTYQWWCENAIVFSWDFLLLLWNNLLFFYSWLCKSHNSNTFNPISWKSLCSNERIVMQRIKPSLHLNAQNNGICYRKKFKKKLLHECECMESPRINQIHIYIQVVAIFYVSLAHA